MNIIKASTEDIATINRLAHETWPDTFAEILTESQIAYMLNMMYSPVSLKKQMENGQHFLLAEEGQKYYGYASYELNYKGSAKTKLHKIYVHPSSQGKGVGKLLMDSVIDESLKNGIGILSLNVNRYNKALHFYKKIGFEVVGEENIDIGQGYLMEDYILEKTLHKDVEAQ